MLLKICVVTILGLLISEVSSSKILVVHTTPSPSHLIVGKALYKELAIRGHDLTVINTFPLEKPLKNYREINIPISKEIDDSLKAVMEDTGKLKMLRTFGAIGSIMQTLSNVTMQNKEVIKLMKEEKFDLVILGYFMNEYQLGFGAHFKCPTIVLFSGAAMGPLNKLVGNPAGISHVPHLLLGHKGPMSFGKRVGNTLASIMEFFGGAYINYNNEKIYQSLFTSKNLPSYDEILKNVSLVFVNSHFSQGTVRPNQPNMIEIGGIQAKEIPSPLPEDIKEWLDSAKDGAIFMSLGSNMKSSSVPREKIEAILKTFGKLKQKILWKWEDDHLPGKPDNVKIGKWLPQDDILAHPNVKLFITHGGLGSMTEAKFHGVPILGIPLFADQPANVHVAESQGWAVSVDYSNISEKSFNYAVNEVLSNKKYSNAVKEISNLFRDRPLSALDTAVYWTEYVLRTNGAKHLQSNAVHLNFFQLHSLDVLALLLVLALIGIKIQIIIFKFICCKVFGKVCKTSKVDKKKKNK